MTTTIETIEKVQWAACRIHGERVFTGCDHYEAFCKAVQHSLVMDEDYLRECHEEGFLSNRGRWLSREEAYQLAVRNQQLNQEQAHDWQTRTWLDAWDVQCGAA